MAGKTAAKLNFEGEDISTDAPDRRRRLRDNKRKNNNEERSLKPSILEIQYAIADAAAKCGRPKKRMGSKLAKNHPVMIELMEAMTLRSMAAHPLARYDLNKRVCSCRIKVRTLELIAQAELILNNPRMPRRRPVAQQRIRSLRGTEEGAEDIFEADKKGKMLTDFYASSFEATAVQRELPRWVSLKNSSTHTS